MDQIHINVKKLVVKYFYQSLVAIFVVGFISGFLLSHLRTLDSSEQVHCEETLVESDSELNETTAEVVVKGKSYAVPTSDDGEGAVEEVCVDIAGAVTKPGVYCVQEGAMVIDLVNKAGGFRKEIYATRYVGMYMNLSEVLDDAGKIYIPYQKELKCEQLLLEYTGQTLASKDGPLLTAGLNQNVSDPVDGADKQPGSQGDQQTSCVDLNSASKDQLTTLDGVGESTAESIIAARPFSSVNDLLDVSGIGSSKFEAIKKGVCDI